MSIQTRQTRTSDEIKAVIVRMMQAYGISKIGELAKASGHKADTIRSWSRPPCTMPYPALDACSQATGRSMDWLVHGVEQGQLIDEKALHAAIEKAILGGVEYSQIQLVSTDGAKNLAVKISADVKKLLAGSL